jgi:cephalosporin hydroxylase
VRFDDVWMQPWQTAKLAELASSSYSNGEFIEIGTHQGLSAIPIANAIHPRMLHVVDHWKGSTDFRDYMRERDNFGIFIKNVAECTRCNITIHKQDWRDFAQDWTASIGFLHLDAEHTEAEVLSQIGTFRPYMVKGAILAGDDYNWPGVRASVAVHFKEVNVLMDKLWWVTF